MVKARPAAAEIQGFFCPMQPPRLLELRLRSGKCIRSHLGLEKLCAKCGDYWPMDTEFWFPSKTEDGLFNWCRACYIKQRWPLRGTLPIGRAPANEVPSFMPAPLLQAVSGWSAPGARA